MGLFKRAASRGVAHELVRQGLVCFPSKEAMDEAADAVADSPVAGGMPEMSPEGGHSPEELAAVANKLMEIAHALMEQAGAAAPGSPEAGGPPMPEGTEPPPPPSPEAAKMSQDLTKTAATADYTTVAGAVAVECMTKAAEEVKQATGGTLIHGGDKGNDAAQAAQHSELAELDKKQRPEGIYHHGMGKTELDTMVGHIGDLSKNPAAPTNTPHGTNSLSHDVGASKAASLDAELKKIANKLVGLHDGKGKNTLADAAKHDPVAALDQKNRPQGTYLVGQGNANIKEEEAARIGKETPHPKAPSNHPAGVNSVVDASKTSAEEEAFVVLFKKTAEDVGAYLPAAMNADEKVAAISRMIGYNHDARQEYLDVLNKTAQVAPVVSTGGEPQKKEGALLGRIRDIATASTSAS